MHEIFDHKIYFGGGHVIDKGNYHLRTTLESWHTARTTHADNNSRHHQSNTQFYFKNNNYYACSYFLYFIQPVFIYFYSCINKPKLSQFIFNR